MTKSNPYFVPKKFTILYEVENFVGPRGVLHSLVGQKSATVLRTSDSHGIAELNFHSVEPVAQVLPTAFWAPLPRCCPRRSGLPF